MEMQENSERIDEAQYPLLSRIDNPEQLRQLDVNKLPQLSKEIRSLIIDTLAHNPGHFASSMGAVDFIVALHYVFNTPHDRIVWDVGHQAYAHKILTGRKNRFHTNRTYKGLSGFPNPKESEYDTFSAGHASNSVSAALGMAVASELKKEEPPRNIVAVIGDASISGGLAFEGLNNASNTPNNLLIILNDNEMSIDPNVGSLHRYLKKLHASRVYNKFRFKVYNILKRCHLVSERGKGFITRFNNSLKSIIFKQHNIFEGLNVRYFGPYDGHDIELLVKVLRDIKDIKGPRILHLKTKKGKGWEAAEKDPAIWHAPGKYDPITAIILEQDDVFTKYQDVFGETLAEMAVENPNIIGITAAMPSGTSMSIVKEKIPQRVFDVGISEGHAVTFAAGLAKEGLRPYVAIYSSFLQRAFDNIVHDVAIQQLPIVFCIDRAGLVGEDGVTHHGTLDLSYMGAIPGMIVAAPRNEIWLRNLLFTSQYVDAPFAIRYPRGKGMMKDWRIPMMKVDIGKGELLNTGDDVIILSMGPTATLVKQALEKLKGYGITATHYDAVFLKPFDSEIIDEIVSRQLPVVTVEDASVKGGLYSTVAELIAKKGAKLSIAPIGIPCDRFVEHGSVKELQKECGMDVDSIVETIINITGKQ